MKRVLIASMLLSSSMLFGAETASWFIATEPGYMTESGTQFSSSSSEAASSSYPVGSVIELVSEETGRSTVVTITDPLPELPEGRTIAVTEKAMEDLGLMHTGVGEVEERALRLEPEPEEIQTGWYMYDLGNYQDAEECYADYTLLRESGLRPFVDTEGDSIHLYVGYVMAFQGKETESLIRDLGLDPGEALISPNPYS